MSGHVARCTTKCFAPCQRKVTTNPSPRCACSHGRYSSILACVNSFVGLFSDLIMPENTACLEQARAMSRTVVDRAGREPLLSLNRYVLRRPRDPLISGAPTSQRSVSEQA